MAELPQDVSLDSPVPESLLKAKENLIEKSKAKEMYKNDIEVKAHFKDTYYGEIDRILDTELSQMLSSEEMRALAEEKYTKERIKKALKTVNEKGLKNSSNIEEAVKKNISDLNSTINKLSAEKEQIIKDYEGKIQQTVLEKELNKAFATVEISQNYVGLDAYEVKSMLLSKYLKENELKLSIQNGTPVVVKSEDGKTLAFDQNGNKITLQYAIDKATVNARTSQQAVVVNKPAQPANDFNAKIIEQIKKIKESNI